MAPSPEARAALDDFIVQLAQHGDGLTLEEFRLRSLDQAQRTQRRVRRTLYVAGLTFMLAILLALIFPASFRNTPLLWVGLWAMSLGGLGAIASIFLLILKLVPQPALHKSEELEVFGRIFLGCLFSLVFAITVVSSALMEFYNYILAPVGKAPSGSAQLLLPFLCGYSIPLVLGILGKAIQAVEITLGFEDRRGAVVTRTIRRRGSQSSPGTR